MRFFSPPPLAALSPLVTTGLDPVVHIDVQRIEQRGAGIPVSALAAWIAGLKGVHARLRGAMLGNDEIECVLAARFFASEYCRRRRHEDSPLQNREAERRKAHCPTMSAPTDKSAKLVCARLRAVSFFAARRLSALTLAALATGYYPDGSAPEPGFPRRPLTGVSPASPTKEKRLPQLSTLRADR